MSTTTTTKIRTDYTEGSIVGSVLKMALPSMIGFLSQHTYSIVNMFWVSRLPEGEEAVAGVTFFANLLWVFFAINSLIGPGSVAVISRRYGEKEYDLAEKAIKETIFLKLVTGGLFGLIGALYIKEVLILLGATGKSYELAVTYGEVMILWLPILFATYSVFTGLRAVANPHSAMALMVGSNILNLILDPILMFGYLGFPAMGIRGAAVATVISFTSAFVIGMILFYSGYANVPLKVFGKEKMSWSSMWILIKIGIPVWLGELSWSLSRTVVMPMVASFGSAVVAAYGVGMQLFGIGIALLVGIGLGISSLVGHNMGAGKYERAKTVADHAIYLSAGIMVGVGILAAIFARQIMGLFFSDPAAIEAGVILLRIFAVGMPFYGVLMATEHIHMGVGLNIPVMIIAAVHGWFFQALPILAAVKLFGFNESAVWWVLSLAGLVSASIFYTYYRRGKWLTVKV